MSVTINYIIPSGEKCAYFTDLGRSHNSVIEGKVEECLGASGGMDSSFLLNCINDVHKPVVLVLT